MSWLEQKYISLLSHRLRNFRSKGSQLYNASCPNCGDSTKNTYKARFYIYNRKGDFWVHCHNCGLALPFPRWLKDFDKGLYETYLVEKLDAPLHKSKQPDQPDESFIVPMDKATRNAPLARLWPLSEVNPDGYAEPNPVGALMAYQYVIRRQIPEKWLSELYYIENFYEWTNQQIPNKYDEELYAKDEPRLLIPGFDFEGRLSMWQSRILVDGGHNRLRYLTAVLPMQPKLWGLNHVDFSRDFYCLEGPLDAMFCDNAIATCGGKISSEILKLKDGSNILEKAVVCYDHEPRNLDVVKNLWKAIRGGYKVVIWPNISCKDVNDMAQAKYDVWLMMRERTFSGLNAEQEFALWNRSGWSPN